MRRISQVEVQRRRLTPDSTAIENRAMAREPTAARRPNGPRSLGRWRTSHLVVPGQAEAVARPHDGLYDTWPAFVVPELPAQVLNVAVHHPFVTFPFVTAS